MWEIVNLIASIALVAALLIFVGGALFAAYKAGYHRGQEHAYRKAADLIDQVKEDAFRAGYTSCRAVLEDDPAADLGSPEQVEAQRRAAGERRQ